MIVIDFGDYGDNYFIVVEGTVTPADSGDTDMFLRSDDASQFYINLDGTAIPEVDDINWEMAEDGCCNAFLEPDDPNMLFQTTFVPLSLSAGKEMGFSFAVKEGGGGDYGQVAWRLVGDSTPAADLLPIAGAALKGMVDPTGTTVEITQQPQDLTAVEGGMVTFQVVANTFSPYDANTGYQWYLNGDPIEGENAASLVISSAELSQSGDKYKCGVSLLTISEMSAEATLTVVPDTFPPVIESASALASESGTTMDVGVTFDEVVTETSASAAGNYSLSAGTIESVTYFQNNWDSASGTPGMRVQGVVITASGLSVGESYSVTVSGVEDLKGNVMESTTKAFKVGGMKWGAVGADEQGAGRGVVAVAENGFDIYADGVGEWGTYDEATFVYEEITGDFERVLRVEFQDNSSQWARAGLIARDVTNFGVDRTAQTDDGEAGRYQKVHVNPVGPTMTGPGTNGNGSWEGNRRLDTGAATTTAGGGGTPEYPDAWCRMVREGQTITIFSANGDGEWIELGSTTWGEPDAASAIEELPDTLYVGPEFSPENVNITNEGDRGIWVAKIRDYGEMRPDNGGGTPEGLSISLEGGEVVITWTSGVLQSSMVVTGPYEDVAGATSPYATTPDQGETYFRLRQ